MLLLSILVEAAWFIVKFFVLLPFSFCCLCLFLDYIFSDVCRCETH